MIWEGWFTLALLAVMIYGLTRYAHVADVIFLGGLTILGLVGVITPAEALGGFANPGMLTVAALFVVAAALRDSGAMETIGRRMLGPYRGERRALAHLMAPMAIFSAFLNNTTIVAMGIPAVLDWCRKNRLAPSRFLMPLSFITVAAGTCTLIGTSTNLVVHGLMIDDEAFAGVGMSFFEIGAVGVPLTLASFLYLVFAAPAMLPRREGFLEQLGATRREYMVEMSVDPNCPLIGETVQDAGLRQLPGLFLVEIDRDGEIVSPVAPDERLRSGDRLVFVGVVSTIIDLQRIRGLSPAADDASESGSFLDKLGRHLCEVVVSETSPWIGRSIREANFRTVYDAAVIAVHRNGARLRGKIGDVLLRPGDTLLLQTATGFYRAHRNNPDFYLVSEVGESEPIRHERASHALAILAAMVALMALPDAMGWLGMEVRLPALLGDGRVMIAFAAAGMMVITRCVGSSSARRNIRLDVLFVIGAAFGFAEALNKTGAAGFVADGLLRIAGSAGPVAAIAIVYLLTNLLTEFLTNNAAAALAFPIAVSTAVKLGVEPRAFAMTVTIAASAAFATPIGYQTNLMIFGPGGYRFSDFPRVGLPLNVICFVISVVLIPLIWPLGQ